MSAQNTQRWTCPVCGRAFAKKNQWHSCRAHSIEDHFRDKDPQLRQTYEHLVSRLREAVPLRIDAVKTSINFVSKLHFGGVTVRKSYLRVGFISDEKISSERVLRSQRLSANRVGHTVRLNSPSEVDDQIIEWLSKAYHLQS